MSQKYLPPTMSPLAAVFSALVGLGTLVLLFFFGLIIGAVLLVAGVAVAIYLRVKVWRLKRNAPTATGGVTGQIIEGQYRVVESAKPEPEDRQ